MDQPALTRQTVNMFADSGRGVVLQDQRPVQGGAGGAKARGMKLGSADPRLWKGREHLRGTKKAIAAAAEKKREETENTYAFLMPEIKERRERGQTLPEIVEWLNGQGDYHGREALYANRRLAADRPLPGEGIPGQQPEEDHGEQGGHARCFRAECCIRPFQKMDLLDGNIIR